MSHVIVIAVNGILTLPSDSDGWTDRLVVQVNAAWPDQYRGDKYEYFCSPLLRMAGQEHRGEELFGLIGKYEPDKNRIHLVGHSNGCDLIERAVRLCAERGIRIAGAHLIAGACEHEMTKAGWCGWLRSGILGKMTVWWSPEDRVLQMARGTGWLYRTGIGYGWLGLVGPRGVVEDIQDRVTVVHRDWDHSEYFTPGENWRSTVETLWQQVAAG